MSKLKICCTKICKEAVILDPYSLDSKCLNARAIMGMRYWMRPDQPGILLWILMDMLSPVEEALENILVTTVNLN